METSIQVTRGEGGIFLTIGHKVYWLPFTKYPELASASADQLAAVSIVGDQIYWNKLDFDLDQASLDDPDQFPLIYR